MGGAQSELVRALWVRYPERVLVPDPRKAEFDVGCYVRVFKKRVCRCATRALQRARKRLDGGVSVAAIS